MSAISEWGRSGYRHLGELASRLERPSAMGHVDCPREAPELFPTMYKVAVLVDGLAFFGSLPPEFEPPAPKDADIYADSFAFDGQVPESCIEQYIGGHAERLVEGFTAMIKPRGMDWMSRSRIKSIINHKGSVLVQLEQAV